MSDRTCTVCQLPLYGGSLCFNCSREWAVCVGGPADGDAWRLHTFAGRVCSRIWINGYEYVLDEEAWAYVHTGERQRKEPANA